MIRLEGCIGEVLVVKHDVVLDGCQLKRGDKTVMYAADDAIEVFWYTDPITLEDTAMDYEQFTSTFYFDNPQMDQLVTGWAQNWVISEHNQREEDNMVMEQLVVDMDNMATYECVKDVDGYYNVGNPIHVIDVDTEDGLICVWYDSETYEGYWMDIEEFNEHFLPKEKVTCCSNNK